MPNPSRRASEFAVEWLAVAALYLTDLAWARLIDFHLLLSLRDWAVIAGCIAGYCALRALPSGRVGLFTDYVFLTLSGTLGLILFSFLCMASAYGPLMDQAFLKADLALGFNWIALHDWVMAHPPLARAGGLLYLSQVFQGLYCTILLGLMQDRQRMKELWRITFIASLLCCLIGMLLPALGPFKTFNLRAEGTFVPTMEHLLSHRHLVFTPASIEGVICFPSLHTVMALAIPYGLRGTGAIFRIFLVASILLLFTVPFFGGHYLVDMLAGVAVMLASVVLARLWLLGPAGLALGRDPLWVVKPA